MKKEQKQKLFLILDILLTALLVIAGICLMVQCVGIYHSGSYTPEKVAAAFRPISIPVYACVLMIAVRFIAHFFEDEKPQKAQRQVAMLYRRAAARADVENCPDPEKSQILALREARKIRRIIGWAVFAGCSVAFLIYALNPVHFTEDITGSMRTAAIYLAAALALPFGWAVYTVYKNRASLSAELELLKKAPKLPAAPAAAKKNYLPALRIALIVAAVVLTVVGLNLGGTRDVLTKAINICTECVGLG